MYISKSVTAQELPTKLEEIFNENGWDSAVKFRVKDGKKYADVRLFKSYGTDYETRAFGMAFGYDTSKSIFADNRIISETSELGILGIADGATTTFYLKASPVDTAQNINVYVNGAKINTNSVTITNNIVEFANPPEAGSLISISYKLDDTAPEPPSFLVFFTYGGLNLQSKKAIDAPIKLADGDGVTTVYNTPSSPIKAGTLKVWNDSVEQIEGQDYTVDLTTGAITFTVAPALGKELTVKYTQVVSGAVTAQVGTADGSKTTFYTPTAPIASNKFAVYVDNQLIAPAQYTVDYSTGEITFTAAPTSGKVVARFVDLTGGPAMGEVFIEDMVAEKTFDPSTPLGTMHAVYRALDFIQPSLPTVLSFSEAGLGNAWQRDSKIHIKGQINKNAGFFHLRPDAGANALDSLYAPLYFGRMLATHKKATRNMVMFAGASTSQEIKWSAGLKIGGINVDYGPRTSNGNSTVQVAQTIGGAYYQAHYLKFFTHSKDADVSGEGVFNPSKYLYVMDEDGIPTPAYTISRMRLTHPNDGDSYELEHMYAMHAEGIGQQEMMRISELGEWETIGFGDGYKTQFILSRNKHKDSALVLQVNCVERQDYTYDEETRTVTFSTPIEEGQEVVAFYGYKQEYQFFLATTPRCPTVLATASPYAPIGTLTYKKELE